ncbi:iron complex outermembrane recepter protein [Pedobacter sp. ok626]|uniref:TonB-dependent siderophore receptor n=1 Tax=Pedobacter sp. ok626 TaxID=1761882 RepID=UPI0008902E4A|nr:TonB-dependent siderophore receptor [Pedobacter sp. ok626]SDL52365.1 iron complex outermembrane recepter protein [Pedobacter sp. ok626]
MSKLRLLNLITLLSLFSITAIAQQSNSIKGKVLTADGQAAAYVSVGLKGKGIVVTTDNKGEYSFVKIKDGHYTIRVSAIGLKSAEKTVTVSGNQTVNINFSLLESADQLKEVVVSGNKKKYKVDTPSSSLRLDAPLLEVPQNIQIITSATLADQQITSMSDGVIRNVSGVTRLEHWGDIYTRVNTRGARAAAFRNGINLTSDWGPLTEDMSFVDHIEFVKGPSGFMMSNGEPSGIYNVVTKKPTGKDFNGEASFTLGSFDMYRSTLDLDGKLNKSGKLLYRLNLMGQTKNSHRPYEYNDRYSIAPVISYQIDDQTLLTAEYNYQHVNLSDLGSAYVFAPDGYATLPRNFTMSEPGLDPSIAKEHSLFLNMQHHFNANWKLTAQLAYVSFNQKSTDIWPSSVAANGDVIRDLYLFDAALNYKFGQVFLNGNATTGSINHRILVGLDVGDKERYYDFGQSFALDNATKPFNIYNPVYGTPINGIPQFDRSKSLYQRGANSRVNQSYTGLYLQDELGFLENKIRLTLAGRYTLVKQSEYGSDTDDKKFTPRVGLSVSIDDQTSVYGLYDQTFIPQTGSIKSGEQPKPITGNNIEFGIKKDWFDGRWNTTIAAYRILKNNELSPDPTSTPAAPFSLQLGQSTTKGIEFDLRGEILPGLNLIANYALTDSRVSKETEVYGEIIPVGTKITGYAKHNANAWLSYKIQKGELKGAGISGGFSYLADRSTWSWGGSGSQELPSNFKLDGGIFWEKDKIRLTANVYNILDKYLYSGASYGDYYYWQSDPPRNYRLSIAYKF